MSTEIKPTPTNEQFQARFNALLNVVGNGGEGKARVAAHLSCLTMGKVTNLKDYHTSFEDHTMAIKYAEYSRIAGAFGITKDPAGKTIMSDTGPDWSKLEGQTSAPAAPAKVNEEQLAAAWASLNRNLKAAGNEGQQRVAAHIRTVTAGKFNNLGVYHISKTVGNEGKYKQYAVILNALAHEDWGKLEGQLGVGAKVAEVEEVQPTRIDPHAEPEIKPEPAVVTPPAPATHEATRKQPNVARDASPVKGAEESLEQFLIRKLSGHITGAPCTPSEVDEGKVRLICAEEVAKLDIHAAVKKANANGAFPTDRVEKLIKDALVNCAQRIELVRPDGSVKPIEGLLHPQVVQIATYVNADVPAWAWSGAGSGKTHMARQIAEMLELDCYVVSVDPTLTVSKLLGYRNVANGEFVEGFLYKPFKEGGLVALDEGDTGDAGVIASLNSLLANGHYLFPNNETVKRHPKFRVIVFANSRGTGAVAGYVARNKLDAATLDRFALVEIKYDEGLEMAVATGEGSPGEPWKPAQPASQATLTAFVKWVQSVRAEVGQSVLISPRASMNGCKLLRAGVPMAEVVSAVVTKLCANDTITRINDKCGQPKEVL